MAIGAALRVPLRVAELYVRPGDEQRLFPNFPVFLSREDVLEAFPRGLITHERFYYHGAVWCLVKRAMAQGNSIYMAVLDDAVPNGGGMGMGSHSTGGGACVTPDTARSERLRSLPLDAFAQSDVSDVTSGCSDMSLAHPAFQHAASMPPAMMQHHAAAAMALQQPPSATRSSAALALPPLGSSSVRDRVGSYNNMALVHTVPSGGLSMPTSSMGLACSSAHFTGDLVAATESPMPMDRLKAFGRLFSYLYRMRENLGLPPPTPTAPADALAVPAWDNPDAQELVRQVIMVGECLAKFGTAEFVEARNNNAGRAITTKDYASLLRRYLQENGAVFREDFITRLPLALQDEALTVRMLLQTRCETNDLLFNQLVKSVGQEPGAGGAMVFNHTNVSANPTNHMLAAPKTLVNTVSNAWSKADVKRRTQLGALGAVAVVALWVLKRKLFGGGSGLLRSGERGRGGRRGEESEWGGSGGPWSSRIRGSGDLTSRLVDERSYGERMAVRFISACQDELRRSLQNDQLLRSDWRLGPLRLAMPGSGSVPTGYEPVQTGYCSVASYMNVLDRNMPPFLMAPPLTDRPTSSGGGSAVARESVAGSVVVVE